MPSQSYSDEKNVHSGAGAQRKFPYALKYSTEREKRQIQQEIGTIKREKTVYAPRTEKHKNFVYATWTVKECRT